MRFLDPSGGLPSSTSSSTLFSLMVDQPNWHVRFMHVCIMQISFQSSGLPSPNRSFMQTSLCNL